MNDRGTPKSAGKHAAPRGSARGGGCGGARCAAQQGDMMTEERAHGANAKNSNHCGQRGPETL